jgi:hypothetical protein
MCMSNLRTRDRTFGISVWYCCATRSSSIPTRQCGHSPGSGASCTSSAFGGVFRNAAGPCSFPDLRPGGLGSCFGSPFENGPACLFPARRASSERAANLRLSASSAAMRRANASFISSTWALSCPTTPSNSS